MPVSELNESKPKEWTTVIKKKLFTIEMSNNTTKTMTYQKRYHQEKLEKRA